MTTVRFDGNLYTRDENGVWANGAGVELNPNLDFIPRLEELAAAVEAADGVKEYVEPAVEETVEPLAVEAVEEATSADE